MDSVDTEGSRIHLLTTALFSSPLTHGIRARPRSGVLPWGGNQPGHCCGFGRRSAGGAGAHRASWHGEHCLTGNSPPQHSRAYAEGGPQCKQSLAPVGHGAVSRRQLQREKGTIIHVRRDTFVQCHKEGRKWVGAESVGQGLWQRVGKAWGTPRGMPRPLPAPGPKED